MIGIYQIRNKFNNKIYIGSSSNIPLRWWYHWKGLHNGDHHNNKLIEDFNQYGGTAFEFSVLYIGHNESEIKTIEQNYINEAPKELLYNIHNPVTCMKNFVSDYASFIDFVNKKWLIPDGITKPETNKYRIYKEEDKDMLVRLFVKFKIKDMYYSHTTFNRVIGVMKEELGYTIVNTRSTINNTKHTCKLITSFDESKIKIT